MELVDIPLMGKKLNWLIQDRQSMSKSDMILLYEGIIDLWKVRGNYFGDRDIADHCSICIKCSDIN